MRFWFSVVVVVLLAPSHAHADPQRAQRLGRAEIVGGIVLMVVGSVVSTALIAYSQTRLTDDDLLAPRTLGTTMGAFQLVAAGMGGVMLADGIRANRAPPVAGIQIAF